MRKRDALRSVEDMVRVGMGLLVMGWGVGAAFLEGRFQVEEQEEQEGGLLR